MSCSSPGSRSSPPATTSGTTARSTPTWPGTPDCPFRAADEALAQLGDCRVIIVDMHAEATSEKAAIAWYLDGRVSAVIGSHTHIPTADTRILRSEERRV